MSSEHIPDHERPRKGCESPRIAPDDDYMIGGEKKVPEQEDAAEKNWKQEG